MSRYAFGFERGWSQVRVVDRMEVKAKLKIALNVKTDDPFYKRRKNCLHITAVAAERVEEVFESYGIYDVWGKPKT